MSKAKKKKTIFLILTVKTLNVNNKLIIIVTMKQGTHQSMSRYRNKTLMKAQLRR